MFRSLLAGALIGGAQGAAGGGGGGQGGTGGGFWGAFGRGMASGGQNAKQGQQQQYERARQQNQDQRQASEAQQKMTLEQQHMSQEAIQNAAIREHYNMESMNAGREANLRDREQLLLEDNRVNLLEQKYLENGATLANVPGNGTPGNADAMKKLFTAHPERFTPPQGMGRVLIKSYNLDDLNFSQKDGWTDSNGKPADPRTNSEWKLYFVPSQAENEKVSLSGKDLTKFYGLRGIDQDRNYQMTVGQLTSLATTTTAIAARIGMNTSRKSTTA
jgi:hypothetical protein